MMDHIRKLMSALSESSDIKADLRFLDQGVAAIAFSQPEIQLFIYPDDVTERLRPTAVCKTIHLDQHVLAAHFDKVLARIQTITGHGQRVYARQTVVARVDKRVSMAFLEEHHLLTAMPGKYRYGLYHEGELVCLAIFSGGRKMQNKPEGYRSFELIRFCHKKDQITIGGLSKLITAFRKDFKPGDLMTYVDRDWTLDSSLQQIGFRPEKDVPPQSYTFHALPKSGSSEGSTPSEAKTCTKRNSGSTKLVLSFANTD